MPMRWLKPYRVVGIIGLLLLVYLLSIGFPVRMIQYVVFPLLVVVFTFLYREFRQEYYKRLIIFAALLLIFSISFELITLPLTGWLAGWAVKLPPPHFLILLFAVASLLFIAAIAVLVIIYKRVFRKARTQRQKS